MSTPQEYELIRAAHDNWNVNHGAGDEFMLDTGYDTADTLPATLARLAAESVTDTERFVALELVTDDHQPHATARHEATVRRPRKPRTWRDRLAADQPPASQLVTPHGHDYPMTAHQGGRA